MDELESRLQEAGEAWRDALAPSRPIDPAWFVDRPGRARGLRWAMAGAAIIVVVVAAVGVGRWVAPAPSAVGDEGETCPVTVPVPPFGPPAGFPATPPGGSDAAWFGNAELWTVLGVDGEVWTGLPRTPAGLAQKTFWWSAGWVPETEPQPDMTVSARRIGAEADVPADVASGPATNAAGEDIGDAILVGIELPGPGCWELTGRYRDATLRYVVWVDAG